jgi:hypothetical protein
VVKRLEYEAIKNNAINFEVALSQATVALDIVGLDAVELNDSKLMMQVAEGWIKIAKCLNDMNEPVHHTRASSRAVGFSGE